MVQPAGRAGLLLEAAKRMRIVHASNEELDRHASTELEVACDHDATRASLAQLLFDNEALLQVLRRTPRKTMWHGSCHAIPFVTVLSGGSRVKAQADSMRFRFRQSRPWASGQTVPFTGGKVLKRIDRWHNRRMGSNTITRTGRRQARRSAKPFLFIALRCDRPMEHGARIPIHDADVVWIGRGKALSVNRHGRELRIDMLDPRMSSKHLRLESVLDGWIAEDLGSKNGTLVEGRRISREPVADSAVLELGHTFLLFRSALTARDDTGLLDANELEPTVPGLATLSPTFAEELERLRAVAASRVPILLRGESGTGKEVLAAAIHHLSRRPGAFQPVNCGAIPATLVESQLFGHRRGAFTTALDEQPGLVRGADRGTLLLDEIGDLPLPAQGALLRVLQEEEVLPVGATRPVKVDLRVVSATHRDLDAMVTDGQFRADLLARLTGYVCALPPLRERREDFSLFVASLLAKLHARETSFTPEAARALLRYAWPRNMRELEKCLESAKALAADASIDLEHLPLAVRSEPVVAVPAASLELRERLIAHLRSNGGNVTAVARTMGKARTQVQRWMHRFGLDPLSFRR